jgi:hypothetical protein
MNVIHKIESDIALANWAQSFINSPHTTPENRDRLTAIRDRLQNGFATSEDYEWIQNTFFA